VDEEWRAKTDELAARFLSDEWLYQKRRSRDSWWVRIRAGVQVKQGIYKAPGGLIRFVTEVQDDIITAASISGNFFFFF
jgi:lipoate-protein ligase A